MKNLGAKPRHTWQEAVVRWISEHPHKKSMYDDKLNFRWLNTHLNNKHIDEISKALIEDIRLAKLNSGVKNATVNRTLALLRAVLRSARDDWDWLDQVPTIKILPELNKRLTLLTHEAAERLLNELPLHLNAMARFAKLYYLIIENMIFLSIIKGLKRN